MDAICKVSHASLFRWKVASLYVILWWLTKNQHVHDFDGCPQGRRHTVAKRLLLATAAPDAALDWFRELAFGDHESFVESNE